MRRSEVEPSASAPEGPGRWRASALKRITGRGPPPKIDLEDRNGRLLRVVGLCIAPV